jgi:phosphate transport system protein
MQSKNFDVSIHSIDERILSMAKAVEDALLKASHALKTQDIELAKAVKKGDRIIDGLQSSIEELVVETIATQQPVATDLRLLMSAMKLSSDFERAGDYAVHLAKATKLFVNEPAWRQIDSLEHMAELCIGMIRQTVQAYATRSASAARQTAALDDEIDHMHKALIRETLSLMKEHPDQVEKAAKIITVSGFLERLGDHMTNACEAIVFMVEGIRTELNE